MVTLSALILLLLAAASLFGWGSLTRRLTRTSSGPWPTTIGLGLAAIVVVGGVVNLLRVAYAPVLLIIFIVGLVVFRFHAKSFRPRQPSVWKSRSAVFELSLVALLIATVTLFTILTQVPPRAFNFHDDLEKYFAHPVRMLATGTLYGSPLSALGSETLGGQAFLHGFVLAAFPIQYINAVDALFGLVLLMTLAASAGWRRLAPFPAAILGPIAVVMIPPQSVNVSSLFTGAALVATAVLLVADDRESSVSAPVLGIVYAALFALKPTLAMFFILHLPLASLTVRERTGSWRSAFVWAAKTTLWATLAIAPWILLHLPNYLRSTRSTLGAQLDNSALETQSLFSTAPLVYGQGATFAHYTAIIAVAALAALASGITLCFARQYKPRPSAFGIIAGAISAIAGYLIFILALGSVLSGYESNLRYTTPLLLGAGVVSTALALGLPSPIWGRASGTVLALAIVCLSAAFAPSFPSRYRHATNYGNVLAFSATPQMSAFRVAYTKDVLRDGLHSFLDDLQSKVPADEPIIVWISTPFHLDYRRNRIIDAEPAGLTTPWASPPAGVKYYLWEYNGPVVRREGNYRAEETSAIGRLGPTTPAQGLAFATRLSGMTRNATILYEDQQYVLFETH